MIALFFYSCNGTQYLGSKYKPFSQMAYMLLRRKVQTQLVSHKPRFHPSVVESPADFSSTFPNLIDILWIPILAMLVYGLLDLSDLQNISTLFSNCFKETFCSKSTQCQAHM